MDLFTLVHTSDMSMPHHARMAQPPTSTIQDCFHESKPGGQGGRSPAQAAKNHTSTPHYRQYCEVKHQLAVFLANS